MDKLSWCLKDAKRLTKAGPDIELAHKHLEKSKYNYLVLRDLEKMKRYDWALNVGFYAIYHCFLALLAKYGYESRNQSCTVAVLLHLIDKEEIRFDKELVLQFDTFDSEKDALALTARESRELSTYGVETSIDLQQLDRIKQLTIQVQKETMQIIGYGSNGTESLIS